MRWLIALSLVLPLLTATPAHAEEGLEAYRTQEVSWRACGQGSWCATVEVPLDYGDPGGARISLSLRASAPAVPDGSRPALLVNPGGPGATATDYVSYFADLVGASVSETYDIVAFDPRGVGESSPIECLTGPETTRWLRTDTSPTSPGDVRTLLRRAAAIGPGCLRMSPDLARHVGSENTVSDMDVIRSVLGQEMLNWFGFSYGTLLGATYAQRFPERVGRMVLDGAVDPSLDAMELSRDQSRGFQTAIRRFAEGCARAARCPLGSSTSAVIGGINRLLARLERSPLPTDSGATLVQAEATTALFFGMYSTDLWPLLEDALASAQRGDGTDLAGLAAIANQRTGPTSYSSNINSAFLAIGCWDSPAPPGRDGLASAARRWSKGAVVPDLATAMAWGNAPCSTWFGHASQPPSPVSSTTDAGILIIGTRFDPATPYTWARSLARQLPTSRLLTFEGDGHTAYGAGSACVQRLADAYLLTASLPAPGTRC